MMSERSVVIDDIERAARFRLTTIRNRMELSKMMRYLAVRGCFAAIFVSALLVLSGCAVTTSTGKNVVSAAQVGKNLNIVAAQVQLAMALYGVSPSPNQAVLGTVAAGVGALQAAAASLSSSAAVSGDVQANISLGTAGVQAALAALATVAPVDAAKATAYAALIVAAVNAYNADAALYGSAQLTLPATAAAPAATPAAAAAS